MSYSYTDKQINSMLDIGYSIMKHATSEVQNCTFPNAAIVDGMRAGNSPEEIANAAYESIIKLDPMMDGYRLVDTYNSVAHPFHNAAQFMAGEILTRLNDMVSGQSQPSQPTYTYTKVNDIPEGTNPATAGYYEEDGNDYKPTSDQEVVENKNYYIRTQN